MCNICGKCLASKHLVMGVVILVTAIQWPDYIWHVIGGLLILKGILFLAKPKGCGCDAKAKPKGKKK